MKDESEARLDHFNAAQCALHSAFYSQSAMCVLDAGSRIVCTVAHIAQRVARCRGCCFDGGSRVFRAARCTMRITHCTVCPVQSTCTAEHAVYLHACCIATAAANRAGYRHAGNARDFSMHVHVHVTFKCYVNQFGYVTLLQS